MKVLYLLLLLAPINALAVEFTSMTTLLSNLDKYHGKKVILIGVAKLEAEENILCDSKEHLKFRVTKNCIWISLKDTSIKFSHHQLTSFNNKYVIIQGTVNSNDEGRAKQYSASLENITRYDQWE